MSTQSYQSLSIYHPPILELRHSTFLGQQECDLSILGNIPLPVAVQKEATNLLRGSRCCEEACSSSSLIISLAEQHSCSSLLTLPQPLHLPSLSSLLPDPPSLSSSSRTPLYHAYFCASFPHLSYTYFTHKHKPTHADMNMHTQTQHVTKRETHIFSAGLEFCIYMYV